MLDARGLREGQEDEIALGHSLTAAEHALAREAVTLGRTFERAGIAFDPLTFITLRIVEGSSNEYVDPVACLDVLVEFGVPRAHGRARGRPARRRRVASSHAAEAPASRLRSFR